MKVTQLSVFLENKPGTLSRPVNLLARAGLNILALSLADTQQFGILRLIVQDWSAAKELLEKDGFVVKVNDLVALEVSDAPGGLAGILAVLEKNIVNLEYMYGFTQRQAGRGLLLFRFEDPDRAIQVLQKHGINPVHSVELFRAKGKMARKAAAAT
jgi:hypothetical protein